MRNALIDSGYQMSEVFFQMGDAVVGFLRAFSEGKSGLYEMLSSVAKIFDFFRDGFTDMMMGATAVSQSIKNHAIGDPYGIFKRMGFDTGFKDPIQEAQKIEKVRGRNVHQKSLDAFKDSATLSNAANQLEKTLKETRKTRDKVVDRTRGGVDDMAKWFGSKQGRDDYMAEMTRGIVDATKKGSQDVVDAIHGTAPSGHDLTGAAIGHVLASYALRTRRRG